MVLTITARFLSLPCAPDTSLRFTSADRFTTPDKVQTDSPRGPMHRCSLRYFDASRQ